MELHVSRVLAALAACCALSAAQEYSPREYATRGYSRQGYMTQESSTQEYSTQGYPPQEYSVLTEAGWVCGACDPVREYAYYLGVPYAEQPTRERRFKELQRLQPWQGCLNTTQVGPVCPQRDLFYGSIMNPSGQSEECIHANVYVPLQLAQKRARGESAELLPVLVYVHGGGFDFGSGDPDAHSPEYLVKENVIVITFNYRLGVFGFLSLNTPSVPGNAGLRDMVTLLKWVNKNAKAFGGDPSDVTMAGQSAGSAAVHILSLSKAAEGLFHRAILMSGTATRGFFTTSPAYARTISDTFLGILGINGTDPEEAHRKLVALPLDTIMEAHNQIQDLTGLLTFTPVVESEHPGVKRILDDDPETLQAHRGKNIPFIIGFTNVECETFRPRFEQINIVQRIINQPVLVMPPRAIFTTLPEKLPNKIMTIQREYFGGAPNIEKYLKLCSDSFFIYPALKLAETRAANGGAPVFMYRFAYNSEDSVYKKVHNLKYHGAGHSEDLTFVFRPNYALQSTSVPIADRNMTTEMTKYFTNFMRNSKPTSCHSWPPVSPVEMECGQYHNIVNYAEGDQCRKYRRLKKFFDSIYDLTS